MLLTTASIGKVRKKGSVCFTQFCSLSHGFNRFKPGLTYWAGQNQFNPGKMPTLHRLLCHVNFHRCFRLHTESVYAYKH